MEPTINVNIALGVFNGKFFMKVTSPASSQFYWMPIPRRKAQILEQRELLNIETLDHDPTDD